MGTQAHWFRSKWRYRLIDAEGEPGQWVYGAETLGDVLADVGDQHADIEKRSSRGGRDGADYTYGRHSVINAPGALTDN